MLINFKNKLVNFKNGAINRKPEQDEDNDFQLKW
jgi:hypothetical protein